VKHEHAARARHRVEMVDEDRLLSRRNVRKRQRFERGIELRRKPFDIFLGLHFDIPHRKTCGFCLAHADGFTVQEENIVDISVALVQLEFADSNGIVSREVHFIAVLKCPACRLELAIDLDTRFRLRRIRATCRHYRSALWKILPP
jgi:hypothetical protein